MARPLQIGLPLRGLTRPQITLVIPGPAKPSAACALALRQGRGWAGTIPLDKIRVTSDTALASPDLLLPVATALADIPALALTEVEASDLRHGEAISLGTLTGRIPGSANPDGGLVRAMAGGRVVGLARLEDGLPKPERVL